MNGEWQNVNSTLVACTGEGSTEPLVNILVVPDGKVTSISGDFVADKESWRLIDEAFRTHGTYLPIDYEHQTLGGEFASPDGKAPAAGWITRLHYEEGRGIIALVEWTETARQMIRAKEYRYLSPVLMIRKADSKAVQLLSAGLTNVPAIQRMEALAAKQTNPNMEKKAMAEEPVQEGGGTDALLITLGQVIQAYDLEVTSADGPLAVLEALLAQKGGASKKDDESKGDGESPVASKAVREAIGVDADADESAVVMKVKTLTLAANSATAATDRLKNLEDRVAEQDWESAVRPHLEANRINPKDEADVTHCRKTFMRSREEFEHEMTHRQAYAAPGRTTAPPGAGGSNGRETIIANKTREFHDDPDIARLTSKAAWVGEGLREKGLEGLTDKEREALN